MLDPKKAHKVALAAAEKARHFFGLSPEWEIHIKEGLLDDDQAAEITPYPSCLRAHVAYDLRAAEKPADLWQPIGHEVAHLVLAESRLLYAALDAHFEGAVPSVLETVWRHADEAAVSRLERMFLKHCPYQAKEGKQP